MALLGGIVGKLLGLVLLIVVLLVATGIFLYATDYAVKATVSGKDCSPPPGEDGKVRAPFVTVKTSVGGLTENVDVTPTECALIATGNFVEYHLRTQRTIVYEREGGRCVYDTAGERC